MFECFNQVVFVLLNSVFLLLRVLVGAAVAVAVLAAIPSGDFDPAVKREHIKGRVLDASWAQARAEVGSGRCYRAMERFRRRAGWGRSSFREEQIEAH